MKPILRQALSAINAATSKVKIEFDYEEKDDRVIVYANGVTLNNHDDDIRIEIVVNDGQGAIFYAVFDKLEETRETLRLLNRFNENSLFFQGFVREETQYLVLRHLHIWDDVSEITTFVSEGLSRLGGMADNKDLIAITKYTR